MAYSRRFVVLEEEEMLLVVDARPAGTEDTLPELEEELDRIEAVDPEYEQKIQALEESKEADEFRQMERLEELTGVAIPKNLQGLQTRKELHTDVIPKDTMLEYVTKL